MLLEANDGRRRDGSATDALKAHNGVVPVAFAL